MKSCLTQVSTVSLLGPKRSLQLCDVSSDKKASSFSTAFPEILFDVSKFQKAVTVVFPQRYGDIAILARVDGNHPSKFQPSFSTGDGDVAKRFEAFNGVVTCQDRLQKPDQNAPICPLEKQADLYCKIIRMPVLVSELFST